MSHTMGEFSVRITSWADSYVPLTHIRTRVFVLEQNVPPEEEVDAADAHCTHAIATSPDGTPMACGRLLADGRIGRMAVLSEWRGKGVGGVILQALVDEAATRGVTRTYLHAQTHAIAFYERHGFTAHGPEFLDANIPHREMVRGEKPA
jgi:predicted GNAT family N-acyltransferase